MLQPLVSTPKSVQKNQADDDDHLTTVHEDGTNPHLVVWTGRFCPAPGHPPAWSAERR